MDLSKLSTYRDLMEAFSHLVARLEALCDTLPYEPSDARLVSLRGMQGILAGYGMGMHSMFFGRSEAQVIESMGITNLSSAEMFKKVDDVWRWGTSTLFHFRLDSLFTNILTAAQLPALMQFRQKAASVLVLSAVPNQGILLEHLLLLTAIRNSLHNNGIHRNADLIVTLGTNRFWFAKDRPVQCATWQHILVATDAVVSVIDVILHATPIGSLPQPIPDMFADAITAGTARE